MKTWDKATLQCGQMLKQLKAIDGYATRNIVKSATLNKASNVVYVAPSFVNVNVGLCRMNN